ncbi:MAG: hypothetical protein ACPGU5_02650 [Lishizhenia sp.]
MNYYGIADILYFVSEYLFLIVGLLAILKQVRTKKALVISIYLIVMAMLLLTSTILAQKNINNLLVYNIMGVFELVCVYFLYQKEAISKYWRYVIPVLVLANIYSTFFVFTPWSLNSYGMALSQLAVILMGCNYSFRLITELKVKKLSKHPFYFIHLGFIIYASGCLFINLMSEKIVSEETNDFFHNAWILECIFNIIRLSFISYGLILLRRE